jgi:pimeloyl-ACP methyl ester carboxylesterase
MRRVSTRGWPLRPTLLQEGRWGRLDAEYRSTEIDGQPLHWVASGSGPAVVLLHGLCGSLRWWNANIPALASSFRVLALDLPGFGASRGRRRIASGVVVDLVARWIEQVSAAPAHLVGHSMGGLLAIHLAARYPQVLGRLVLADSAGLYRPLAPAPLARWMYGLASPRSWGDPGFLPVIWRDAFRAGPITAARALHGILREDVTGVLPRIQSPTLVVWGERDPLIPPVYAQRLREAIPGARLHVIQNAYHNPMIDQPEEFNQVVGAFLRGEEVGA